MDDLISRQSVIDAIEKLHIPEDMCVFEIVSHIELAIGTLPSAQPERTQFDCDMAYMQGKTDGIRECTEQLRKLKIKMEVEHE